MSVPIISPPHTGAESRGSGAPRLGPPQRRHPQAGPLDAALQLPCLSHSTPSTVVMTLLCSLHGVSTHNCSLPSVSFPSSGSLPPKVKV